ncbi:hypothetical protein DI272_29845 [Streptomyces sp. Act143]|uniref:helix-turn-helix domain-containing protein n=1 Tax=Streptomyces sp. Act143 TaxID=2200760 RepID=UPI000D682F6E|nr:hypothetical protein DI272_29845 [Streptomyces sp. Act143]
MGPGPVRGAQPRGGPATGARSQREPADLLGITRVPVARALSRLRRAGLIRTGGDGKAEIRASELPAPRAAPQR